jgi:hypothetical protein
MFGKRARADPAARAATAVAAVGAVLLAASPALAATDATNVTWGKAIQVKAGPAMENRVFIGYVFLSELGMTNFQPEVDGALVDGLYTHVIADRFTIPVTTVERTDGPSCFLPSDENQLPAGAVHCPDGTAVEPYPGGGEDFRVFLGDRADWFSVQDQVGESSYILGSIGEFEVNAGPGNDEVYGNDRPSAVYDPEGEGVLDYQFWSQDELRGDSGNDLLIGGRGADTLNGGPGADKLEGGIEAVEDEFYTGVDDILLGGPGNDRLNAWGADTDHTIDCGPGKRDKAIVDRGLDPKPNGCEVVKKRRPADLL